MVTVCCQVRGILGAGLRRVRLLTLFGAPGSEGCHADRGDRQSWETSLGEEELTAYAATTGRFALYPYIREYVYDLTGRLALPPLTLEILSRPMPVSPGAQWPATRGTP